MNVNQILGGRYQVVKELGASHWSSTYLVEDTGLSGHPECVVRRIPLPARSPRALKFILVLLKKKAEALKYAGAHDQIPKIFDYFEEDQTFYLVEEFITGHPLSAELPTGKVLPESAVIDLMRDVLEILVVVHSWGVVHRNINPYNLIRRSSDRRLVLTGFGIFEEISNQIARSRLSTPEPFPANGSAVYAPDEQFHGKVHFNTDLYAVGMIGIQALTGLSTAELVDLRQANGKTLGLLSWYQYAQTESPLVGILNKMVHPEVQQRYHNATEVLDDLKFLTDGALAISSCSAELTTAETHVATRQGLKRPRGRWLVGGAIATVTTLALLGVIYAQIPQRLLAQYFLQRASAQIQQGQEQEAIATYTRAIQNHPSVAAHIQRGQLHHQSGNWQAAQADFSRAIELRPDADEAYYYRGNIRYEVGDRQGALEDYTQAIRLNPAYAPTYVNRGSVRAELGDEEGALADYTQAIQQDPSLPAAYLNRCLTRSNLDDHQGAIEDCSQAISLEPTSVLAYQNRGLARRRLGDIKGAIEDLNIAIRLDPKDADPYYNRGLARFELGDQTGAIADYTQAIQLNPDHAFAYYDRAMAYLNSGDTQKAIADLQQSAKLCLDTVRIGCYEDAQYQLNQIQSGIQAK
jgi:serine/threonine-protein kinase